MKTEMKKFEESNKMFRELAKAQFYRGWTLRRMVRKGNTIILKSDKLRGSGYEVATYNAEMELTGSIDVKEEKNAEMIFDLKIGE